MITISCRPCNKMLLHERLQPCNSSYFEAENRHLIWLHVQELNIIFASQEILNRQVCLLVLNFWIALDEHGCKLRLALDRLKIPDSDGILITLFTIGRRSILHLKWRAFRSTHFDGEAHRKPLFPHTNKSLRRHRQKRGSPGQTTRCLRMMTTMMTSIATTRARPRLGRSHDTLQAHTRRPHECCQRDLPSEPSPGDHHFTGYQTKLSDTFAWV